MAKHSHKGKVVAKPTIRGCKGNNKTILLIKKNFAKILWHSLARRQGKPQNRREINWFALGIRYFIKRIRSYCFARVSVIFSSFPFNTCHSSFRTSRSVRGECSKHCTPTDTQTNSFHFPYIMIYIARHFSYMSFECVGILNFYHRRYHLFERAVIPISKQMRIAGR